MLSGYDQKFRYTMIKGILERRKQINEKIEAGTWNRFRNKTQILSDKSSRLGKFPATWFLKGGKVNTLKVIPTPNSGLRNAISKKLDSVETLADGGPTRVIELGGDLISKGLGGAENFGGKGSCFMGTQCITDEDHDCRSSRAVYSISCEHCQSLNPPKKSLYIGTTGRCVHSRMSEHQKAVQSGQRKNALVKHQESKHSNQTPSFRAKVLKAGIRFNTDRFVLEALHIRNTNDDHNIELLNQKGEWGHGGIVRLRADQQQ